jgi:hypothetical protein
LKVLTLLVLPTLHLEELEGKGNAVIVMGNSRRKSG